MTERFCRIILLGFLAISACAAEENASENEFYDPAAYAGDYEDERAALAAINAEFSGGANAQPAYAPQQGGSQSPAGARGLPPGAHRVKRVEIIDRNGFERPMTAYTMLLPADWRAEGGVVWGQNMACGGAGHDMNYTAMSPDGNTGIQLIPSANWTWNNFSGPQNNCLFAPIQSAQQYLELLVSQARPGAQVIDFRPRPDLLGPLTQLNSTSPMAGGQQQNWVDAGEVLIGYNANGVDMRETIAAIVYVIHARMEGGMGMGAMEIVSGSAMSAWSMRAPNGQLDFAFSEMMRKSVVANPEWDQRIARHNAKIAQTNLKGARDRNDIITKTNNEILDIQMQGYRNRGEMTDRGQRESTEAIMGVETYNDPYYGGTVQLDHTYDNAWQLNDGSYVLTNDAGFEPFRDLGVDGQRLEAAQ